MQEDERDFPPEVDSRPQHSVGGVVGSLIGITGAVMVILLLSAVLVVMMTVVPKFTEIFRDFQVELPWLTVLIVNVSWFMRQFWYVTFLVVILVAGALFYVCLSAPPERRIQTVALLVVIGWLLGAVSVTLIVVGMFMPLVRLMTNMQQPTP